MNQVLRQTVEQTSLRIRVRGRVQGVGFRPHVWRLAHELGVAGYVLNDTEGVLIEASGDDLAMGKFITRISIDKPPLAEIFSMEIDDCSSQLNGAFMILESEHGIAHTDVAPDGACCEDCRTEVLDPFSRRFRYPFATCTNCGPRLTVVKGLPYDRATTTMAPFHLCADCRKEYEDPADRRFHAETIACHICGPKAQLIRFDGRAVSYEQHSMLDDVDAAMSLVQKGEIVAIKALGGYQLACDATKLETVEKLRFCKKRDAKPFALMARDIDVIGRYCEMSATEEAALKAIDAPIVLLKRKQDVALPEAIAPGLSTLGFMLPSTPLHHLMFRRMTRPVVMTSGNVTNDPQIIDDDEAQLGLKSIADYALVHNRAIANRVDDGVVRMMSGEMRVLRRGRGTAPSSIALPAGFETAPAITAFGGDVKAAFCLIKDGRAILSQHQGDLESVRVNDDFRVSMTLYDEMFAHEPKAVTCDRHGDYFSSRIAHTMAQNSSIPVLAIQHHHAHVASCLAENSVPLNTSQVLGIALDGSGAGLDDTVWGGEFLLCDYQRMERLATFKPVALPGGEKAVKEPWRNLTAHLSAELGWAGFVMNFADLPLYAALNAKPQEQVRQMIKAGINSPLASSCGRLFDSVAAALGLCFDRQDYEGEAGAKLESIVCEKALVEEDEMLAYPFNVPKLGGTGIPYIEPLAMWNALLGDLILKTPASIIAARFHKGLAKAIAGLALKLAKRDEERVPPRFSTVVLTGGCFQNRILIEQCETRLRAHDFTVLSHRNIPANDGGLSLGQGAIAAAHLIHSEQISREKM